MQHFVDFGQGGFDGLFHQDMTASAHGGASWGGVQSAWGADAHNVDVFGREQFCRAGVCLAVRSFGQGVCPFRERIGHCYEACIWYGRYSFDVGGADDATSNNGEAQFTVHGIPR
jgi:hypothetical protein